MITSELQRQTKNKKLINELEKMSLEKIKLWAKLKKKIKK